MILGGQPPGKAGRRWGKETPIRKTLSVYFFAKKQVEKFNLMCYTEFMRGIKEMYDVFYPDLTRTLSNAVKR